MFVGLLKCQLESSHFNFFLSLPFFFFFFYIPCYLYPASCTFGMVFIIYFNTCMVSYWYNLDSNYWSTVYKHTVGKDYKFKVGYDSEVRLGWASLWVRMDICLISLPLLIKYFISSLISHLFGGFRCCLLPIFLFFIIIIFYIFGEEL